MKMKAFKLTAAAVLIGLLAACGGGGGNDDTASAAAADDRSVPTSALASASAYSQWAGSLVSSDTGEAVVVDAAMAAPRSETEDPIGLR